MSKRIKIILQFVNKK